MRSRLAPALLLASLTACGDAGCGSCGGRGAGATGAGGGAGAGSGATSGAASPPATTATATASAVPTLDASAGDAAGPSSAPGVRATTLRESPFVVGIRKDRAAALLRFGDVVGLTDDPHHRRHGYRYAWFDLAAMQIIAGSEWEDTAWQNGEFAPGGAIDEQISKPAFAAAALRHAKEIGELLGQGEDRVVVGSAVAYADVGDRLVRFPLGVDPNSVVLGPGIPGAALPGVASNDASLYFLPEKTGWSLVSGESRGRPLMKTGVAPERPRFAPDGSLAYVRAGDQQRCLVRVDTKTAEDKELACLPAGSIADALLVSPSAAVAALTGRTAAAGGELVVVVVDLPNGAVRGSFRRPASSFVAGAVTDDGQLVGGAGAEPKQVAIVDVKARKARVATQPPGVDPRDCAVSWRFRGNAWITSTRYVSSVLQRVSVCDLAELPLRDDAL